MLNKPIFFNHREEEIKYQILKIIENITNYLFM